MKSVFNYELVQKTMREKGITQMFLADYLTKNGIQTPIDTVKAWFRRDETRRASPEINKIRLIGECLKLDANQMISGFGESGSFQKIKIIGEASCGAPISNNYQCDDFALLPEDCCTKDLYAVIASGESMMPKIDDGDQVICDPKAELMTGDLVHYMLFEESAIKVFVKNDKEKYYRFSPINQTANFRSTTIFFDEKEAMENLKMAKVVNIIKNTQNNRKENLKLAGIEWK